MITYFQTNKVYLSKGLCAPMFLPAATNLIDTLHSQRIVWGLLPQTDSFLHIWSRDFMPIQVNKNKFIRFRYEPDYLKDSPDYKPDTASILDELGIEVIDSDIVLDGGNIISCGDKVIMTDKIFKENPNYKVETLLNKLTDLLEAEPVIIPWDKYEIYGHADGMVRYMGDNNVLLNNYYDFDKSLRNKLIKAISPHFNIVELHYDTYTKYSWAYINFLHVGKHIFIPGLDDNLQDKAFLQIRTAYPECKCLFISNYKPIVKEGGALNCSTWNILTDITIEEEKNLPLK